MADLLVTDHLMPGMSGTELVSRLRADRPDLPALVVSGYADVQGLARDVPRLVKPFKQADLVRHAPERPFNLTMAAAGPRRSGAGDRAGIIG